jgi:acetyl esterase/lipase
MFERLRNAACFKFIEKLAPTADDLRDMSVEDAWRQWMRKTSRFTQMVSGVSRIDTTQPGGAWLVPKGASDSTARMMFIHGGAFVSGSVDSHKSYASALAKRLNIPVFLPNYRLAPEHPYPAPFDDVRDAYDYVCEHGPNGPSKIEHLVVAGDSAGGNLSLALHHRLTDEQARLPDALLLVSPMTDMTHSLPSWRERIDEDPMLRPEITEKLDALYYRGDDKAHPYRSPLHGDPANVPPTLIFVGGKERLYDDSVYLARKLRDADREVRCIEERELFHDWPLFIPVLPAANRALDTVERWYHELRR